MDTQKIDAFKRDLKYLLDKYNAYIYCDLEGDTHGLSTKMMVEIDKKDYLLTYSSDLDKGDL